MPETRKLQRNPRPADDYAEEDRPAQPDRRRGSGDDKDITVTKGWGGYSSTKAKAPSKWAKLYKIPDDGNHLIMFLEDGPYANFLLHWCDWVPKGHKQSYVCLQDNCPLDDVNDPSARARFNILDLDGDEPVLMTLEIGITVSDTLKRYNEDDKTGPIGGKYFAISKSGPKNRVQTNIHPVKVRDVEEDWHYEPLSKEELAEFRKKMHDDSDVDRSDRDELEEVARMVTK